MESVDIAVIGAGAAGLMAAIWAGRGANEQVSRWGGEQVSPAGHLPGGQLASSPDGSARRRLRIIALDGARTLGAKILVAGGGRCNVTHDVVDETAFAGSSRHAIKKVLRQFGVEETVGFFRELGVELKREETGKLFPVTDRARTVLDALLRAAREAGVEVWNPWRVGEVVREGEGFVVRRERPQFVLADDDRAGRTHPPASSLWEGELRAARVILATGGKSLPKTGSDGAGYGMARGLGHSVTGRVFPALVPLMLPAGHFLCGLSGVASRAMLEVRSGTGKRLVSFTDSVLCTHFGLSGPGVLDVSRYFLEARAEDAGAKLVINWLPGRTMESLDAELQRVGAVSAGRYLAEPPREIPERLARALCETAGVDASAPGHRLTRERRRALSAAVTELVVPVTGDRGFAHAEVTAGGVPLSEVRLETMESRVCPGLHLCGEVLDVDGRIGGYNFQWAWASGYVAGRGAVAGMMEVMGGETVRR